MSQVKLLAFAGSTRVGSFNKLLAQVAAEGAREAGAEVSFVDLRDLPMPIFDGDIEAAEGLPVHARTLKALFREHQGLLIASPEYNSSITAVLKNAIDWVSRVESTDEPSLSAFRGKTAAIMSASPGPIGGLRGLVHLRSILSNIGVLVLPDQIAISAAYEAFEGGKLKDPAKQEQASGLGRKLAKLTAQVAG